MKLLVLTLLVAVPLGGRAAALSPELPDPSGFRTLLSKAALPVELRDSLHRFLAAPAVRAGLEGEQQPRLDDLLADPGEPYQATDTVVLPSHLAPRRLILAGDGTAPFVAYEHGGIARHGHLVFFARRDGTLQVERHFIFASSSPRPETLDVAALWREVRNGHPMPARDRDI